MKHDDDGICIIFPDFIEGNAGETLFGGRRPVDWKINEIFLGHRKFYIIRRLYDKLFKRVI